MEICFLADLADLAGPVLSDSTLPTIKIYLFLVIETYPYQQTPNLDACIECVNMC